MSDPDLTALIEQVNNEQVPALLQSGGQSAWLVPNAIWKKIQSISLLVSDPELAKEQREKRCQELRDEGERLANDPEDRAEIKRIQEYMHGSRE
ncbi:hypothetical protein FEZ60_30875 [Rhodococcus sp. MS16]|uniref:hypothetical protein n=1 Tax=Rhodococcus sp. MS16 TaxID=2579941 RepID=UPI0015626195|nr:hypothetical protein [Rhodococcus sp. MS16]NRI69914.1 hypothetical protein [Rhodococcus sp. MS16]